MVVLNVFLNHDLSHEMLSELLALLVLNVCSEENCSLMLEDAFDSK